MIILQKDLFINLHGIHCEPVFWGRTKARRTHICVSNVNSEMLVGSVQKTERLFFSLVYLYIYTWVTLYKIIHPGRLTWNLKNTCLKRKNLFQTIIFRFYVNLWGCNAIHSPYEAFRLTLTLWPQLDTGLRVQQCHPRTGWLGDLMWFWWISEMPWSSLVVLLVVVVVVVVVLVVVVNFPLLFALVLGYT